jgi:NAD(P)-dependent dehydrogenase (short-subunit alcohol dehydrogenase family)
MERLGHMSLDGKYALITGSSRGIGRGIALKLAEKGVKVAIGYYQNEAAAKETLSQVKERGSEGFLVQSDLRHPESIANMFEKVKEEFPTVDIFVANARGEAATFYQPPMDITQDSWNNAFDSQARAFHLCVRQVVDIMPHGGRIIAITYAPSARLGSWQPWIAMGAAKAAMESLVRYWAVAVGRRGITINSVSPGATDDSVLSRLPEEVWNSIKTWHESGWTPMGRVGTPADVGNVVALLCMEEAGFITGQTIYVDGGASIMDPVFPLEIQQG